MGICKNINVSKNIDNHLKKNCNNNIKCKDEINRVKKYLNSKINCYKMEINRSKNIIKKYSNNMHSTYNSNSRPYSYSPSYRHSYRPSYRPSSNSHSYRHASNTTSNIVCNNLSQRQCINYTPICQWHSRNQVCMSNKDLCQNKKSKKICDEDGKCAWVNNRCHNKSRL